MDAAPEGNKLQVAPGSTDTDDSTLNLFDALGFETFVYTQTIQSPYPSEFAAFGAAVGIDDTALNLVVGSPKGSLYLPVTFDYNFVTLEPGTTFDGNSTTFFDPVVQSGVVYTYDYLPSSQSSVNNPGAFIFGQQVANNLVRPLDQYGTAVNYTSGVLAVGAPGQDLEDSSLSNYGAAFIFENPTRKAAWAPQYVEQPVVDIRLLTSVYMYDRITSAVSILHVTT
jgi:hypothetical protein